MIAQQKGAPFYTVDRQQFNLQSMTIDGTVFDFGSHVGFKLSLLGFHQLTNVQTVLTALDLLIANGMEIPEEAIRRGLEQVKWPARFEKLSESDPMIIYDGAHNPQGVRALVKSIAAYFPDEKVNILSGVMGDKEYGEMVERLKPVTARAFVVTPPNNPRSLAAGDYADVFSRHGVDVTAYEQLSDAVREAIEDSRRNGCPLICMGSLYLYQPLSAEIAAALQ